MKKKIALWTILALSAASLAACGSSSEGSESTVTETAEETAASESAPAEATLELEYELVDGEDLSTLPVEEYGTLGEYKGLEVTVAAKQTASEEKIEENVWYVLEDITDLYGLGITEGVVEDGNDINLDYEGKIDGEAFDGGTASGAFLLIGSDSFIDGFEEGLIGVAVGETVDLTLTFPETYWNSEMAGKEAVFTCTVNYIVPDKDDPETDALLEASGNEDEFYSVAEIRQYVEEYFDYQYSSIYYNDLDSAILKALDGVGTVTKIPSGVYQQQYDYVYDRVAEEAAYYGYDADTYCQLYTGLGLADYALSSAQAFAKQGVLLQMIANAEELNPSDEDIDAFVAEYMTDYGYTTEEEFYEENTAADVKYYLMQSNVLDFLIENAVITEQ